MAENFRTTIERLWQALGLGKPRFSATDRVRLTVDGYDVHLIESGDAQNVSVWASAGELSSDPMPRAQQIRDLLQSNLAHVANFRPCVCVEDEESETPKVVVHGLHSYADGGIDRLAATIQEALYLLEYHAEKLSGGAPRQSAADRQSEWSETIVFRP